MEKQWDDYPLDMSVALESAFRENAMGTFDYQVYTTEFQVSFAQMAQTNGHSGGGSRVRRVLNLLGVDKLVAPVLWQTRGDEHSESPTRPRWIDNEKSHCSDLEDQRRKGGTFHVVHLDDSPKTADTANTANYPRPAKRRRLSIDLQDLVQENMHTHTRRPMRRVVVLSPAFAD